MLWSDTLNPNENSWRLYKLGLLDIDTVAKLISQAVGDNGLLVIDDLPETADRENSELYASLARVSEVLISYKVKLVTTGRRNLPANLRAVVTASPIEIVPPPFSIEDIQEILEFAGAPEHLRKENVVALVSAITKGLPVLVAATVRWWQQAQWKWGVDEIAGLMSGDPIRDVQEDYRRQLTRLVDDRGREFLYRLSLLYVDIDEHIIRVVTEVAPAIQHPQECLDELEGIWIDRLRNKKYNITPLLKDGGKQNLPLDRQKQIHEVVAEYLLSEQPIEITKVFPITMHLWDGEKYEQLIGFLIHVMLTIETPEHADYLEWTADLFSPEIAWKHEVELARKIMFRALQVRTKVLAGKDASAIDADLDTLIAQAGPEDAYAVLFAYSNVGLLVSKYSDVVPAKLALDMALKVVRALNSSTDILREFIPDTLPIPHENHIWFQAVRLESVDEIQYFLEVIRLMSDQELTALFQTDLAATSISHVLDRLWFVEAEKTQQEHDWQLILAALDEAKEIALSRHILPLEVAEARARAIIYSEHLGRGEDALALLDTLGPQSDPDLEFMIQFTKGTFLFDAGRHAESILCFEKADSVIGEAWSHSRSH